MTHYAPVGNTHVHKQLYQLGILGDYHLLLTHLLIGKGAPAAQDFWRRFVDGTGISRLDITVDNSVVELGESLPFDKVIEAAKRVGATTVVLPDVINNGPATAQSGEDAMDAYVEDLEEAGIGALGIPQGSDIEEVLDCAKQLVELGVQRIGISRYTADGPLGSRVELARKLWRDYELPIHLFGFSNNLLDDLTAARLPGVIGIDSAMPIWYGYAGRTLPDSPRKIDTGRRPSDYEHEARDLTHQVRVNVDRVREWLERA